MEALPALLQGWPTSAEQPPAMLRGDVHSTATEAWQVGKVPGWGGGGLA